MDVNQFKQLPILGILRGVEADIIDPLVETVISSGLKAIEITMNTHDAPNLIPANGKGSTEPPYGRRWHRVDNGRPAFSSGCGGDIYRPAYAGA